MEDMQSRVGEGEGGGGRSACTQGVDRGRGAGRGWQTSRGKANISRGTRAARFRHRENPRETQNVAISVNGDLLATSAHLGALRSRTNGRVHPPVYPHRQLVATLISLWHTNREPDQNTRGNFPPGSCIAREERTRAIAHSYNLCPSEARIYFRGCEPNAASRAGGATQTRANRNGHPVKLSPGANHGSPSRM